MRLRYHNRRRKKRRLPPLKLLRVKKQKNRKIRSTMNTNVPKQLRNILPKRSGRDNVGHISVRHQGGRQKRYYRTIDWKRDKSNVPARVMSIDYDPNRSTQIAL